MDIAKYAYPEFHRHLADCEEQLKGFGYEYKEFFGDDNTKRSKMIATAVNYLQKPINEDIKTEFLKYASLLKKALSLCRSKATYDERIEAAFFESVRSVTVKLEPRNGDLSVNEINQQISEILHRSIKSKGVVNVFDIGQEVSLFDPEFLEKVAAMQEKDLAIKILENLLSEQIRSYGKRDLVKSEEFSIMFQRIKDQYIKNHLTNIEVINDLIDLAKEIRKDYEEGNDLGLTPEELAFYHAISLPENIHDFYDDKTLVIITQELTESLRASQTIDWQYKEKARANMRRTVKRLLRKYKYPPDHMKNALDKVLAQCELWADESI